MAVIPEIEILKARHNELCGEVESLAVEPEKAGAGLEDLKVQVKDLVKDLAAVSTDGLTLEQYDWLTSALLTWQVLSNRVLKQPQSIRVPKPPGRVRVESSFEVKSDEDIHDWLRREAQHQSQLRRAREITEILQRLATSGSTPEEEKTDWYEAIVRLSVEVLTGRINLARQLTSKSYVHLEFAWLEDAKRVLAYYLWENEGAKVFTDADSYYYRACDVLRARVRDERREGEESSKGSYQDFEEARAYLDQEYLENGKLDTSKERCALLLDRKAYKIWRATGREAKDANRRDAEESARLFYENLIPAVADKDEASTRQVLAYLRLSDPRPGNDLQINCFELALAVYFLDPDLVRQAWQA